ALQRSTVREVGDPRETDHRTIDQPRLLASVEPLCQTVLILHLDVQIWRDSHYGNPAFLLQHFDPWIQYRLVAPEFVNDKTPDTISLLWFQKLHRTVQLGEYAASVDISRQKHGGVRHFRHTHIYDIVCFQIDLRRASGSFDHDNVVFFCKGAERLHNIRDKVFLIFKIIPGAHRPQDLAVYDHLGSRIVGRFQENGVHKDGGFDPRRLRLHHLRAPHLQAFAGDIGIQRHVLGFERSHPVAVLPEDPAQSRREETLSRI